MSNYTKSTNFAAKDSLPSGNANKVVKGTEINTEFDNIATAIATKADLNSPTLVTPNLGTPSVAVLTNATGLPLTTGVTGTLLVANGGTGTNTFSSGALLKGAGTSAITTATAGTDYAAATTGTSAQLLANNGSGGFSNVTVGSGLSLSAGTLSTTGGASISAGDSNVTVSDTGSNGTVTVQTDGSERLRIDSSGNVGIGVTPTASSNTGILQNQGGILFAFSNTFQDLSQNAYYNGGYKYTNSNFATLYRQNGGTHQWFNSASGTAGNPITFTQAMTLYASGGLQTLNTISVGNATPSTSGAGITFPATQSASSDANTLDDYEEGTWTPSLGGNTTYTVQSGTYVKIGKVVTINFSLTISTIGTGSINTISGLPFSSADQGTGLCGYFSGLYTASGSLGFFTDGTNVRNIGLTTAASIQSVDKAIFGNGTRIDGCSITYTV